MRASSVHVSRSADRFHTQSDWLDSRHSFNFGGHFSWDRTNHGQLLVLNDDRVKGGTGFETHPHRDMEIVTWVLEGELEHKDSEGNSGLIYPGLAQRMSAGRGIWHSEKNHSPTEEVRFIQMWVPPDTESIDPAYQQADIGSALAGPSLIPIASGKGHDGAIAIHQRGATLWGARLGVGDAVSSPDDEFVYVFVATGSIHLEAVGELTEGDAAQLTAGGARSIVAGEVGSEVLVWATDRR